MEYMPWLVSLLVAISSVLGWIAKLGWSKEYTAAKDEILEAKTAHIELLETHVKNLQDLTPMKMRE
jgi:hypothetical protein